MGLAFWEEEHLKPLRKDIDRLRDELRTLSNTVDAMNAEINHLARRPNRHRRQEEE
jgi:hypothetical protein